MIPLAYRRSLILAALTVALLGAVAYDTLWMQSYTYLQLPLAGLIACTLGVALLVQRYPIGRLRSAFLSAWPLHLFTASFVGVCFVIQFGKKLDQVVIYSVFAYVLYFVIPFLFLLDIEVFKRYVKVVAVLSALLALPSIVGATGQDSLFGIPLRNKTSYSNWSGIIASAGVFEHAEGHAFQMALGLVCCMYLVRKYPGKTYFFWMFLAGLGLLISQGRAAIYGLGVAVFFQFAPVIFRYSRPIFFVTLTFLLTAPYAILDQLAEIPGLASYMRVERGLSGREEAWSFAITVIRENPWRGHGFMASTELTEEEQKTLRKSGFSGAGTTFHNTFITKAVDMGVGVTCLYALLYLVPLWRLCRKSAFPLEQDFVRNMALLILTASLYRDYNIGGVRSTAMLAAIFLGLGMLWPLIESWRTSPTDEVTVPLPQSSVHAT
jgi:O-antigen ligase